jgi:hypothetical protein
MASTTFSGPVTSTNGFITGTAASPLAITTADQNVSSAYVTTSATTGDTRLMYDKLTFTSTGSGETIRAFSVVTGALAATGGTINGAHISMEVDGSGTISGAGNALRATLGGTQTAQTGTLGVLQLDTNYTGSVTTPATSAFIRVTDSGSATGKINNLLTIDAGPAATIVAAGAATPSGTIKKISIQIGGVAYYILAATVWS